jgi:Uma2 family endonuclease
MAEAGLFADERVELLDGTIIKMSPHTRRTATTVARLQRVLTNAAAGAHVRTQLSIVVGDWSEPEPDLALCKPDRYDYLHHHPEPDDIVLICEVALSSLSYDRKQKSAAYAAAGIVEYWIIDVAGRTIIVRSDPDQATATYRTESIVRDGDTLTVPTGGTVAVSDILPPL